MQSPEEQRRGVARWAGFSLHAGIGIEAEKRAKLERLARYVSRPAVSVERLALTAQGDLRHRLKTPYRDGTTHIVLEPLDFLAPLATLVPPPRVHLTRYHGVFAPHAGLRAAITSAGRGRVKVIASIEEPALIERILAHRRERGEADAPDWSLGPRARGGAARDEAGNDNRPGSREETLGWRALSRRAAPGFSPAYPPCTVRR
jgi:hypothetical protein